MIGLQWRPGKEQRKPQLPPVIISDGPSTPLAERTAPPFDPFAAFAQPVRSELPVKRKRGRPRKNGAG